MTACNTFGKKNCRQCPQSSPDDSKIERGDISAITGPLHTLLYALPRISDQSSSSDQVVRLKGSMVSEFPLLPLIEHEIEGLAARPAFVPSLKLKPRPKSHGMGKSTKFHVRSSMSWAAKNAITNSRPTPVTPSMLQREGPSPLKERQESTSNASIVGESLLQKNRTIDRSRTIRNEQVQMKGALRPELPAVPPPTLLLKPRRRGLLPASSINKENLKNCEFPFLLSPWDECTRNNFITMLLRHEENIAIDARSHFLNAAKLTIFL